MKKLLFLAFFFVILQNLLGQVTFYPPKIEISDHTLSKFLTEFTLAVGKKDSIFIKKHLHPNIFMGFDGDSYGTEAFLERWTFNEPDSKFWKLMEQLLKIGLPSYPENSNRYTIPYTFSDWEKQDSIYDPYSYAVITGKNVNLRDAPSLESSIVGQLEYDLVELLNDQSTSSESNFLGGYLWHYICTVDGAKCGYVYWTYVVSPVRDFRMVFEKIDEKWWIKILTQGD
ncbi:SH3 domain-containing protein [Croceitalea rosinachiae]|uniref:SH3 domain-containing protein n=1 Tax=Croceitalea rosinachiae TaxID=3075596 RepID=A0ABU3ACZ6_9FLAO|nr:SH3 domain-containing protein [Croceitalea sp. F388]MDT0607788.1 SH3 domain-containing protein [Croceitalea sp. F388]